MGSCQRWGTGTRCLRRSCCRPPRSRGGGGWSWGWSWGGGWSWGPPEITSLVASTPPLSPLAICGDQSLRWISGLMPGTSETVPGETYWNNLSSFPWHTQTQERWERWSPLPHSAEADPFIFYSQTLKLFQFWSEVKFEVRAATKNHLSIHFE